MIHDFGVPVFLMRMDVVPGRVNHYVIKPTRTGVWTRQVLRALRGLPLADAVRGRTWSAARTTTSTSQDLEDAGQTSDLPLLGGEEAYTQEGLDSGSVEGPK